MKVVIKDFKSNRNKNVDVYANIQKDSLGKIEVVFTKINGGEIKPEFKKYILNTFLPKYQKYDLLNGASPFQSSYKNDWLHWLVKHINSNWSKSPYSLSFYNSKKIGWGHKPEGSLRLSDHWNFTSEAMDDGVVHCATEKGQLKNGWAVGKFHNGKYEIIKKFEDD